MAGPALIKIFAVALSLALDVFAVSVGVGMRGVSAKTKLRIGLSFATAEITMVVLGALLGLAIGKLIGDIAGYVGFVALIGLGSYMIIESLRDLEDKAPLDMSTGWGLLIASLAISLDSLGIGFSILYIGVPLVASLVIIGVVSVCSTALGLTLGKRLGKRAEEGAELWAGIVLVLTGIAFILLKVAHLG
ncbi:MAG: manganese efflux pump MntP family protein [Candidatus Eremiobacteraeota bacterium]|nr:manganese efflux pump MntP family protein [Candidatus Eremiobacteraeota bacterium]